MLAQLIVVSNRWARLPPSCPLRAAFRTNALLCSKQHSSHSACGRQGPLPLRTQCITSLHLIYILACTHYVLIMPSAWHSQLNVRAVTSMVSTLMYDIYSAWHIQCMTQPTHGIASDEPVPIIPQCMAQPEQLWGEAEGGWDLQCSTEPHTGSRSPAHAAPPAKHMQARTPHASNHMQARASGQQCRK